MSNVVPLVPQAPQKSPEQLRIEALEAQLAAMKEPAPQPPKTPEQLRIDALEAALAEATAAAKTPRKARSKPVAPPSESVHTPVGNDTDEPTSPSDVGNGIANRIAGLVGKATS